MMRLVFFLFLFSVGHADVFEAPVLQNIRQVTFSEMGFEKAGEAYFSPDGSSIIFQAVPKGKSNYQIYVMDLGEGLPRRVSTGMGACTCAFFRPDGKKVIFASSHSDPAEMEPEAPGYKRDQYLWSFTPYMNIYESNPDGSDLVALTSGAAYHAECAYSGDGMRIVYASNEEGSMNIYTMRADGSDVRKITHSEGCYNGGPFFSPDGMRIIFRADREKKHYLQIYVVDADGMNERQLTKGDTVNWAPFWYPDGKAVAYTTSKHGHAQYEVYLLNVETGMEYRVTNNPGFDGMPAFNREGNKMLWTSKRSQDNTAQVFIADFVLPEKMK